MAVRVPRAGRKPCSTSWNSIEFERRRVRMVAMTFQHTSRRPRPRTPPSGLGSNTHVACAMRADRFPVELTCRRSSRKMSHGWAVSIGCSFSIAISQCRSHPCSDSAFIVVGPGDLPRGKRRTATAISSSSKMPSGTSNGAGMVIGIGSPGGGCSAYNASRSIVITSKSSLAGFGGKSP